MNVFTFTSKHIAARIMAVMTLFALFTSLVPMQASAANNNNHNNQTPKVKICHANTNGYDNGKKEVEQSSISGQGGHNGHSTGGYNNIGDIIPPFGNYAGKNWTTFGQAIWNNDCDAEGEITVDKIVVGNNAVKASDFILKVGSKTVIDNNDENFAPGNYVVTETTKNGVPTNFVATFGGDCNAQGQVTLGVGEDKKCTLTNTYTPPPVLCAAPYTGFEPNCVPPPCDQGQTGTYPNCVTPPTPCDAPYTGNQPNCVPPPCDQGQTGTYPNCVTPPPPSCSDGFQNQDETGVDTGGICTPPPTPCDAPYTGNQPNCVPPPCDQGQTGTYPNCVTPPTPCDAPYTGNQPNCVPPPCDQGQTGTYPNCVTPPTLCTDDSAYNFGQSLPCTYDLCPDDAGLQTDLNQCTTPPPPPATCTVEIVSNTSSYVVEKAASAVALTSIHDAWDAVVSGAIWIWGDNPVTNPEASSTQTFRNQFGFSGTVTGATLYVASDNGHSATVNGNGVYDGGSTFASATSYNVPINQIAQGNNELKVAVTNIGVLNSNAASNPAGVLYKLVINGTVTSDADCSVPYVPPSEQNTIKIEMCKFDVSKNNAPIVDWGMTLTDGEAVHEFMTGDGGCATANVPDNSGPWEVIEEDPEGWQQDYVSAGQGVTFQRNLPNIEPEMQPWACRITLNTEVEDVNYIAHRCDFFNAPIEVIEPSACDIGDNLIVNGSFEEDHGLANNNWGIFNPVLGWSITLSDGLEIWRNFLTAPSDGDQIAELDGNDATRITQTVIGLTSGATYELQFDFAARSATSADNSIDVAVDGISILATSTANTNWTTYSKTFVTDGSSDISFTDMGVPQNPGGTGTLIDNVVLCYARGPVIVDEQTYKIFGYVWHDNNDNESWDGREENNEEQDPELPLGGRVISITDGEDTWATTTDAYGYYAFYVPAGVWTITENLPEGWEHTYNESYEVTVPQIPVNNVTLLETVREFFIPTAHALVAIPVQLAYGEYNFGNDESPSRSGGGGGGGGSLMTSTSRTPTTGSGQTTPTPKVLGEQVSVVPAGAPDAGAGGTSPLSISLPTLVAAFIGRRRLDV